MCESGERTVSDAGLVTSLAGRYTIERELGRGGMAIVYLATDARHSRSVAIKVLRPEVAGSLGAVRFLREIAILSRLAHPNILPLLDSGDAAGLLYYAMPYVDGESLRGRLIRERQLPVDEAVRIAREVAGALDYAHRQNVLHRDIKPENILLEDGQAVVADFGIARAIDKALCDVRDDGTDPVRTATRVSLGTPAYMSPEQAAGERALDGRSDTYSLGCLLYEMLAGEPPFTGPNAETVIRQHLLAEPPQITSTRQGAPAHVADAIRRALEKTPADRFARAKDFGDALGRGEESSGIGPRERRRFWRAVLPSLAGTAIIAAVGIIWALARPERSVAITEPTHPPYTIIANVEGSAPQDIRNAVQNLIAIRLNQSRILRTVAPGDLERGLTLAGLPDTTPLDVRTARDLAFRESIRTVIASNVDQLGSAFAVTVQVLNAEDGAVVAAEASKAKTDDQIIEAIGQAIDALRERLGERPAVIAANRDIKGVATSSLEAFKHYALAADHLGKRAHTGCLREARNALRHDPEFATAWSVLGFCHNNMGDQDSAIVAWQRALELRDRLSEFGRHNIEGVLALVRDGNPAAALAAFEIAEGMGPVGAANNRAVVLAENFGGHEQAAELYSAIRARSPFGPTNIVLTNSIRNLIALGRYAEADSLYQMIPPASRSPRMQLSLAAAQHNWDELERLAGFHDSNPGASSATRAASAEGMAGVYAARGRMQDGARRLRSAARVRPANVTGLNRSEWLFGVMRAECGGAQPGQTTHMELSSWKAMRAAHEGDSSLAMAHLGAARSSGQLIGRGGGIGQLALALIHARRDRHDSVVKSLAGRRSIHYQVERWWLVANAFERLGEADSSAAYLGRLTARKGIYDEDNLLVLGIVYPFARFRLGRHYAGQGDSERAAEHYAAFLGTFTDPDPEFAWMVNEARRELDRTAIHR